MIAKMQEADERVREGEDDMNTTNLMNWSPLLIMTFVLVMVIIVYTVMVFYGDEK